MRYIITIFFGVYLVACSFAQASNIHVFKGENYLGVIKLIKGREVQFVPNNAGENANNYYYINSVVKQIQQNKEFVMDGPRSLIDPSAKEKEIQEWNISIDKMVEAFKKTSPEMQVDEKRLREEIASKFYELTTVITIDDPLFEEALAQQLRIQGYRPLSQAEFDGRKKQ